MFLETQLEELDEIANREYHTPKISLKEEYDRTHDFETLEVK